MPKRKNPANWYTVADIVEYYGISDKSVWRWIKDGRIKARKRTLERDSIRQHRRMWCVSGREFNRIAAVIAYNEQMMTVGIRKVNAKRSPVYPMEGIR